MMKTRDGLLTVYTTDNNCSGIVFPLIDYAIIQISDKLSPDNIERISHSLINITSNFCALYILKGNGASFFTAKNPLSYEKMVHIIYEQAYKKKAADLGILYKKCYELQYSNAKWLMPEETNVWYTSMTYANSKTTPRSIPIDVMCMLESIAPRQYKTCVIIGMTQITPELVFYITRTQQTVHLYCQPPVVIKNLIDDYERFLDLQTTSS